jgi:phage recombination protein Bet
MSTEIIKADNGDKLVEYTPFGASEKIKLSAAIVRKFVASKTASGAEASDVDCTKFIMLCKSRGLNPFEGDAFLQGYDTRDGAKFSLITAHQAFLKRAEASPTYDGMESGVVVNNDGEIEEYQGDMVLDGHVLIGGWAKVYRRDRAHPAYRRVALKTFDTKRSRWEKDPAGMIVKCAEADALRSSFPNSLAGLYMQPEQESVVDITPEPEKPKRGRPATVKIDAPVAPSRSKMNIAFEAAMASSGITWPAFLPVWAIKYSERASEVTGFADLTDEEIQDINDRMDVKDGVIAWKTGGAR